MCAHDCASLENSLSTGQEKDGSAADDRQDHGDDHQDRLHQLGVVDLTGLGVFHRQGLGRAAPPIVTLHTSAE